MTAVREPDASGLDVRIRDRVWWSDVDKMGVMYFGRYIRFAEMAETELFRSLGFTYDELHARFNIWIARVHIDVDYRYPARLDDEVICRVEVERLAGSSIHFRFPVERAPDGRRLADIGLVVACLDAATLKTTRIPQPLRDALQRHSGPATAPPLESGD